MDNRPIGVFDSGLGGLTGVRELRKRLPNENIVYFGDTGRVPYGSRSPETILQYARQDIAFLLSKDVKCIMAACGTVSSIYPAAEAAKLPVPYLGVVDAAAREAAFVTRNRRIGVIGTAATLRSGAYGRAIRGIRPDAHTFGNACPLFVPLVENGFIQPDNEITIKVAQTYLQPMIENEVDTLILGCTHYPLIRPVIDRLLRSRVTLIDSGAQVARWAQTLLTREDMLGAGNGGAEYYVSDSPEMFIETAGIFLGEDVHGNVTQIDLDTL